MHPFRLITPTRRVGRAMCERWKSYVGTLRKDFNNRCGYCDDSNKFRTRNFTIDHFVPRNPEDLVHEIADNDYYNLVYSCYFCNSAKSNKWFTVSADVHHENNQGFIDPTTDDYTELFKRDRDGRIVGNGINDDLADHIISELDLFLALHNIHWRMEIVDSEIIQIEAELAQRGDLWGADVHAKLNELKVAFADLSRSLFAEVNG